MYGRSKKKRTIKIFEIPGAGPDGITFRNKSHQINTYLVKLVEWLDSEFGDADISDVKLKSACVNLDEDVLRMCEKYIGRLFTGISEMIRVAKVLFGTGGKKYITDGVG